MRCVFASKLMAFFGRYIEVMPRSRLVWSNDESDDGAEFHPWFPSYNSEFKKMYDNIVNLGEWEGTAGQPARMVGTINYDSLAEFDIRQTESAINYIKQHAKDAKPFFMDVNFIKMHNPTNAAAAFRGRSHLGDYSDSLIELDADIGRIMDEIRADAPDTIVIVTADNGAWLDAYPDAGTTPFRGEKGSAFEGGWRVPGIMWWPNHIPAGARYDEMMSHIDCWATLATMVGLTPPPHDWVGNDSKPIYFDSIDNSAYILGKASHSARTSWIYIDGEVFQGARADIGGDRVSRGFTSHGSFSGLQKTPGSELPRTSDRSGLSTISPWTRTKSTTWCSTAQRQRAC
jgi:arylsulfatase A-like enzyme